MNIDIQRMHSSQVQVHKGNAKNIDFVSQAMKDNFIKSTSNQLYHVGPQHL